MVPTTTTAALPVDGSITRLPSGNTIETTYWYLVPGIERYYLIVVIVIVIYDMLVPGTWYQQKISKKPVSARKNI